MSINPNETKNLENELISSSVRDWMTTAPVLIEAGTSLATAEKMMVRYDVRQLPVVDGDNIRGVIELRDILLWTKIKKEPLDSGAVRELMVTSFLMVKPDTLLSDVILEMKQKKQDYALVALDGKVKGIFSLSDVFRIFFVAMGLKDR